MRWPKLQKILPQSLRWRLLLALLGVLLLALVLTGLTLQRLFNQHISEQFRQDLLVQLDQLTAKIELDENGQASIEPQSMSDPRWTRTYSGLYWQIDKISANGQTTTGVLRSRSLWDYTLNITPPTPPPPPNRPRPPPTNPPPHQAAAATTQATPYNACAPQARKERHSSYWRAPSKPMKATGRNGGSWSPQKPATCKPHSGTLPACLPYRCAYCLCCW